MDESTDLVQLKYTKGSNPAKVMEYVVANCIQYDPEFDWWVSKLLRLQNNIISKFKSKYWRTTNKFGIYFPKTVEKVLHFDKEEGNNYWEKALNKEMSKVKFARKQVDGVNLYQARSGSVKDLI